MSHLYLLHFDRRYPGGQNPQHYLGVAQDAVSRLAEHRAGNSKGRLTRACAEKGIGVDLVRVWHFPYPKAAFDREKEIKAKKKNYAALCPLCNPGAGRFIRRAVALQFARGASHALSNMTWVGL